jgi:hypothetical protein
VIAFSHYYGYARMPKCLRDFSASDWAHLRPITQTIKTWRYRSIDRDYRRKPARAGDLARIARLLRGRKVLITIAYSDAVLISWQTRLVRHYIPDAFHVVVDNSPCDVVAAQIGETAGADAYVRAPENPWLGESVASRSHGIALNWAWDNLVRPGEPDAFGFLDHDIFPTAGDDPFAPLAAQDVYGVVRTAGPRWFLWAGFCMFRFSAINDKHLDFGQDWFVGLDTGGGNWRELYSRIDLTTLRQPKTSFVPFRPGIAVEEAPLQWCGTWLHEVGHMGEPRLVAEKRSTVAQMLLPHLDAAEAAIAMP